MALAVVLRTCSLRSLLDDEIAAATNTAAGMDMNPAEPSAASVAPSAASVASAAPVQPAKASCAQVTAA